MIRRTTFFLISLLLSGPFCHAALEWESTRLDLPAKVGEEEIIGVFKFKNTGDNAIEILTTRSSCGCTIPEMAKQVYAPGESGELKAVFTIGNRTGPQRKTITVTTNSPEQRVTRLVLSTDIPEVANIRPKMLLWRKGSEPEWKEAIIRTDVENQISVPEFEGDKKKLPAYELKPTETAGEYKLLIKPDTTTERHQVQFPVIVELPDGTNKEVRLFVLVR
ncbi:DUF1573 domain-containing protein [Rubellicoccus peritrichatus]|uniref:DUF1573 domain-containing protein n=1 Tax=Rubellicoccus peritrichatus TaxID=3080537 RepID=A0AAQ3LGD3_9BACT|nr:DUF1573 domain-containing protein [Puniceicoccus sp. CR14]WOO41644.1 DUF1573 domain-containing protein [Puniceicoccus sp. CR14]